MSIWHSALLVAVGAALGGVGRWLTGLWLNPMWSGFPLGTLLVNALGGLLAGMAYVWLEHTTPQAWLGSHHAWRLLVITGFLGGLTTFSSFSLEWWSLVEKDRWGMAFGHVGAHLGLAFLGVWLGVRCARWIWPASM